MPSPLPSSTMIAAVGAEDQVQLAVAVQVRRGGAEQVGDAGRGRDGGLERAVAVALVEPQALGVFRVDDQVGLAVAVKVAGGEGMGGVGVDLAGAERGRLAEGVRAARPVEVHQDVVVAAVVDVDREAEPPRPAEGGDLRRGVDGGIRR